MSQELKIRRGTTAEHAVFTGANGEITVDTDKKTLVAHDGVTPGGNPMMPANVAEEALSVRVASVATIADLRALEPSFDGQQVSLSGYHSTAAPNLPVGGGIFTAKYGNYSAEVSADTLTGIYVAFPSDPSGVSGAWVRDVDGYVTPQMFGHLGTRDDNNDLAWKAAIESEYDAWFPSGEYLVKSIDTLSVPSKKILMDGFFVIDWESTGAANIITLNGSSIKTRLNARALDETWVLANKASWLGAGYYAFTFTGDNCECVGGRTEGNPAFVQSTGTDAKFTFRNNSGYSVLPGNVADSTDFVMFNYYNGQYGEVCDNSGYGFGHGILYGLSTNDTQCCRNRFWDCGNHCIYISSGDRNTVTDNKAYGINTDIKVRGDENIINDNEILGGTLVVTNRVVDTGNGYAINALSVSNNLIRAERPLSIALRIVNRSGYPGVARGISSAGNVIQIENPGVVYAVESSFLEMYGCSYQFIVEGSSLCSSDAVRIVPTNGSGIDPQYAQRITVSNSSVKDATGSALQITCSKSTITGCNFISSGGTGSSSGSLLADCDSTNINGNYIESYGSGIPAIRQRVGTNVNIKNNTAKNDNGISVIVADTDPGNIDGNIDGNISL